MEKSIHISYLVAAICLLSSITLSAQNYTPFPTENAEWSVLAGLSVYTDQETTTYALDGDTLILGVTYSKMYASTTENGEGAIYHGGMREENQVIYFLKKNGSQEKVLYDFNMVIGDILFTEHCPTDTIGPGCYGAILQEIVNQTLENGEVRKAYKFEIFVIETNGEFVFFGVNYLWIEGIGSEFGLFHPYGDYRTDVAIVVDPTPPAYDLLCHSKDGEELFSNENFTSCFLTTATDDLTIDLGLKLYPNPTANHQFHLKADTHLPNAEIRLYNTLGQLLSTQKWTAHQQTFALPYSGLFYVSIFSEGRIVTTKAIMAE